MSAEKLSDALVGPTIIVQIKHEYGERRVYPVCDRAKLFSYIAGKKTLTPPVIDSIRALGFNIEGLPETI